MNWMQRKAEELVRRPAVRKQKAPLPEIPEEETIDVSSPHLSYSEFCYALFDQFRQEYSYSSE